MWSVHTNSAIIFIDEGSGTEEIVGINAETGDELWRFVKQSENELHPDPIPFAVQDETVFVHDIDGSLGLNRTDGTIQWEQRSGRWVTRDVTSAVDGDGLYIWTARDETIALDPSDATELWTTSLVGGLQGVTTGVAANGVVYSTGDRIRVRSKANGDSKLAREADGATRVAVAGGRLYTTRTNSSADRIRTAYGQR
ncbi:MAG: PQQ-binding-like beta-propeller repeat protein [Halolamina sp.]|uniref:outer membrane protein assembly factor BamB family protein n=1 Tax=Halolamina sp. TaxID=1940283 RepID=UPI002FC39C87